MMAMSTMTTTTMLTMRALFAGWLFATSVAAAVAPRFGAMELAAPTLSPRFYMPASPMVAREAAQDGGAILEKRQTSCAAGFHSCLDIGPVGDAMCCDDNSYCLIDPTNATQAACCAIGMTCNSPCSETEYQCNATVTVTSASSTTTSLAAACCPRACTSTSQFLCPSSLGGGCCGFGQACGVNFQGTGECLATQTPSSSSSALVSEVAPGCTTSQIGCPSSLGGGCCAATMSCTNVGGTALCASIVVTPTASGMTAVSADKGSGGGLSGGAKAGIAVGVIVGCGLVIGAATWWCMQRRRQPRSQAGGAGGGNGGGTDADGTVVGGDGGPIAGARFGGGGRRDMSEIGSESVPHTGPLRDYFGPDAVAGPFTETHDALVGASTSPGLTERGGVPLEPDGPGDIAAPVEIGSSDAKESNVPESTDGRFELYGSDMHMSEPDHDHNPAGLVSPWTPSSSPPPPGEMMSMLSAEDQSPHWGR